MIPQVLIIYSYSKTSQTFALKLFVAYILFYIANNSYKKVKYFKIYFQITNYFLYCASDSKSKFHTRKLRESVCSVLRKTTFKLSNKYRLSLLVYFNSKKCYLN